MVFDIFSPQVVISSVSVLEMRHILKLRPAIYWLNYSKTVKFYSTATPKPVTEPSSSTTATSSSNIKQNEYFDVVVCGGGMVGTAMALALGN